MPRILPRLLARLEATRLKPPPIVPKYRRPRRPLFPPRQDEPPEWPSLLPHGRTQSILLDSLDPLISRARYRRHKAPIPRLWPSQKPRKVRGSNGQVKEARTMDEEERTFWSSPYLRMLASPIRLCPMTRRYLPRDFLIRLTTARIPNTMFGKPSQLMIPDGVEHPSYKTQKNGQGVYIICRKAAIEQFDQRGTPKRFGPNVKLHKCLTLQISHVLRLRVLQELQLLAKQLRRRCQGPNEAPLIRRLTRAEWKHVKATGTISYENAVAVLVVPPLNKDPVTKERPKPSMSAAPPENEEEVVNYRYSFPVAEIMPMSREGEDETLPGTIPRAKTPFYNGVSLFPSRSQRAALHAGLIRLLDLEYHAQTREASLQDCRDAQEEGKEKASPARGDEKGSHAFIIFSDAKTLLRGDTVPLAIALWRIRMWEDEAPWEGSGTMLGGWASES